MMTSQKNKNGNSNTMILVDAEKLSQALTTTFNGVAMIFESLGIESGLNGEITVNPSIAEDTEQKPSKTRKGKTASEPKEETAVSGSEEFPGDAAENSVNAAPIAADSSDKYTEKNAEKSPEDVAVEDQAESAQSVDAKDSPKLVSSVSLDDITKIIVQKIKKDRSNNEKIGQILKTYGVVKVSELPEEKYEAFLTDLSQL